MATEHRLERVSHLLAQGIVHRKETIRDALLPDGDRPPWSKQFSRPDALRFWSEHRYDDVGKKYLDRMTVDTILDLDRALAEYYQQQQYPQGGSDGERTLP